MSDSEDRDQARHKAHMERLRTMTTDEAFSLAIRAGIYTEEGELTPPYRDDAGPSIHRPAE